jgi:hypothetical protein
VLTRDPPARIEVTKGSLWAKTKLITKSPARLSFPPEAEGQWLSIVGRSLSIIRYAITNYPLQQHPCPSPPYRCTPLPDRGPLPPDRGTVSPDRGPVSPDRGTLAPDRGTLLPDRGTLAPDRCPVSAAGRSSGDAGRSSGETGRSSGAGCFGRGGSRCREQFSIWSSILANQLQI